MSTVLLSTIPGHAPVLMGAFPEQMVIASIFTLTTLTWSADRPPRNIYHYDVLSFTLVGRVSSLSEVSGLRRGCKKERHFLQ